MTNMEYQKADKPVLTGKSYNALKFIVTLLLPGFGTLYFTLATIWHLQFGEEVVGTVAALALFLGIGLKWFEQNYDKSDAQFDGALKETLDDEGNPTPYLEFKKELDDLSNQDTVKLKVSR